MFVLVMDALLATGKRTVTSCLRVTGRAEASIGLSVQRICEAVLRNEHAVLAVSTLLQGEYGIEGGFLGNPSSIRTASSV